MTNLSAVNLQTFIDEKRIEAKILFLAEDTPTVQAAAEALAVVWLQNKLLNLSYLWLMESQ